MVLLEYKTADVHGRGWISRDVYFFLLFQGLLEMAFGSIFRAEDSEVEKLIIQKQEGGAKKKRDSGVLVM